jgi:hypothetical protein
MTLDDAPRQRQRQPHAASLVVERRRPPIVCLLYATFVGDDQKGGWLAVARLQTAFGDHRVRSGLFSQNRPENRIERRVKPTGVSHDPSAVRRADELELHVALLRLMHEPGHLLQKGKQFHRLSPELDDAAVELADVAQLRDDRDQPRARLLGFIDHAALPLAHRRVLIFLEHAQVAADHARGRAELVDGQREQRWIWIL